jgi:hypothetical protein
MNKKYSPFIFYKIDGASFLSFAIAMGVGTFIESKYNTDTARILIYNAWWFEAIMVFFVINFIETLRGTNCGKKEKWLLCCSIYLGSLSFQVRL